MRTAIFLGLMILAKAIQPDIHEQENIGLALLTVIFMVMDVIDFIRKTFKD